MKTRNKLLTMMILCVGASTVTAVINKCIQISAISKNYLNNSNSLCYKWRLGNIHYTKNGSGKPVLLLHDLHYASSGYEWKQIIDKLSVTHTVYTIDLLGCGRSEKPNLTYTNYLYVQLICDFIKSEIGHRTNIIATGESSTISIMACCNNSELFDQIMLINPDSIVTSSQIPSRYAKFYKLIIDFPIIGTLLYNFASSKKVLREEFTTNYFYNPYLVKSCYINSYYEASHLGESPKSIFSSVKCNYTKCNIINALKKINNSIYIVGGEGVESIEETISEYKTFNSAIESAIINHTKRLPQLEKPDELMQQIKIFFC